MYEFDEFAFVTRGVTRIADTEKISELQRQNLITHATALWRMVFRSVYCNASVFLQEWKEDRKEKIECVARNKIYK